MKIKTNKKQLQKNSVRLWTSDVFRSLWSRDIGCLNSQSRKSCAILLLLLFCVLSPLTVSAQASFNYTPMEKIPGFETESASGDFYTYITAVYKFGIAAVGIAALFMIMLGGYMYLTSAGNNASMEKAKSFITDAIVGLILALTSYLLLYIINPDLVRITRLDQAGTTTVTPPPGEPQPPSPPGTGCTKIITAAKQMMDVGCKYSQPRRNQCKGSPAYTDCSDYVDTSFKQAGCSSPGNQSSVIYSKGEIISSPSSLRPGDVLAIPGHVVMCIDNGCRQVMNASGKNSGIKISNSSSYLNQGARVIRASKYCPSC